MKRKWTIIIVFSVLLMILSLFGYEHGYEVKYKKISGTYVEQEVEVFTGMNIYKTMDVELPGVRKGMLIIWRDRIGNTILDAGDLVFYSIGFVTGFKDFDFYRIIQCFINILYFLIDIVYNILLLCTLPGELILIFARIPIIGDAVEWCIGSIIEDFGDILGEFILVLLMIYLNKLFFRFISKKRKGKASTLDSSNKLKETSRKGYSYGINFTTKLKQTLKKTGKFIISKKIYLIISVGLLVSAFIVFMLIKNTNKNGGNIIELYDKYGEVSCEFSDIDFPDKYTGNIYIKNNKILQKNNSNDGILFIDGNNWYSRGGDFYNYFGGYNGCNLSIMDEDYLGNKIDTKYVISMLFSGEDADLQAIKCKNKVDDAFNFELPKYCDFENEFSLSGWKEYKYRDLFSFKYPDGLNITDRKFNYMYNNHYRDFGYTPNIFINIYDFNNFIGEIISDSYTPNSLLNNDDYNKYYQLLENIANGNGVKTIQSSDFFDHLSRYETIGPIAAHKINVDGINGLLINYYFTDDKSKGCISQFVTELLLVKSYNEIISIIFKNNFGEVEKVLNNNVDKYYDFYQTQDGQFCSEKDFWLTNDLEEFYKYGGNTSAFEFQINYEIIKEIIRTIKINNQNFI